MRPVRRERLAGSASSVSCAGWGVAGVRLAGGAGLGGAAAGGVQAVAQSAAMTNVLGTSHERDIKVGTLARPLSVRERARAFQRCYRSVALDVRHRQRRAGTP